MTDNLKMNKTYKKLQRKCIINIKYYTFHKY